MTEQIQTEQIQRKTLYYQIVQRFGEPTWKQDVLGFQSQDSVIEGQLRKGEMHMLSPNGLQQYVIRHNHPRYVECKAAMDNKMATENKEGELPRIIGPFTSTEEALKKLDEVRPRTEAELLDTERKKSASVEAENADLRKKIAELEKQIKK